MSNYENSDDTNTYLSEKDQLQLISSLNDSLILENIFDQLEHSVLENIPTDYFTFFQSRIKYLETRHKDNNEFIESLRNIQITFYRKILSGILKKYYLEIEDIELFNIEEIGLLIEDLYHFFILNYRENVIDFFINYILEHKKTLFRFYENKKVKDTEFNSLKKIYKSKTDVVMLYHLYDVIYTILEDEVTLDEVILYSTKGDEDRADCINIRRLFIGSSDSNDTSDENFQTYKKIHIQDHNNDKFKSVFFKDFISKNSESLTAIMEIETRFLDIFPKSVLTENNNEEEVTSVE